MDLTAFRENIWTQFSDNELNSVARTFETIRMGTYLPCLDKSQIDEAGLPCFRILAE